MSRHTYPRRTVCLLLLAAALSLGASAAWAGVANSGIPGHSRTNPVKGLRWGYYTGSEDNSAYPFYQRASGRNKQLLAQIALRPQAFLFGFWQPDNQIERITRTYLQTVTGGDPNVLAQIAVFRLEPWERQACPNGRWSSADQNSYRTWISDVAAGIGDYRVAIVLQPDLAFSMCSNSPVPLRLINYSARVLSALPHTTVYIDGGVHYWPSFNQAVTMLQRAGVRYARGFALNTSEYDGTAAELAYGDRINQALAAAGIPGKHFVINTAENGHPFLNGQYHGNIGNPRACHSRNDSICASLGIPPTANTASRRWGLASSARAIARRECDAYLWVGRPWLDYGSDPFDLPRALALAATSPY